MLYLTIIFEWMPYILVALSILLGLFWKFSGSSILLKIILTCFLVAFSILWWFLAGRKVWEERQGEKFATNYIIKLPLNYNGVFALRFQKSDIENDDPVILLPANGIAIIKISASRAKGLSRSRFSVETQNGHRFNYTGTSSMSSGEYYNFIFCATQTETSIFGCEVPFDFEYSLIDKAIKDGSSLKDLILPHRP
jgi:hypothetical protein